MKTKKNKPTNIIKIGILIFGISLIFGSCEKDNESIIFEENNNFTVKKIESQKFQQNKILTKQLSEIESSLNTKNKSSTDLAFRQSVSYNINMNEALYIESDDGAYHSYTFSLETQTGNNNLENIVLSLQEDGTYNAFISSYTFTEEERIRYNNGENIDLFDKSSITKINYSDLNISYNRGTGGCSYEKFEIEVEYACAIDGCWESQYTTRGTITVWGLVCDGAAGGGGSSDSTIRGVGNPSNVFPNGIDNSIVTTALNPDGSNVVVTNLTRDLTLNKQEIDYLNKNAHIAVDLQAFLISNLYSIESKLFAGEAVNALVNNGEIDLDNRLIYNPIIAQDYKTKMSPAEIVIFETLNEATKLLYLKAATNAYIYAETHFPKPVRNTKGDTFKHTFWNAISTVYIGEVLTKQLTDAHEDITYASNYPNHYKETQMDLYNNAQGRQIAYGSGKLYQLVQNALDNGNLRYLNNLEFTGVFWRATNSSQLIPSNQ